MKSGDTYGPHVRQTRIALGKTEGEPCAGNLIVDEPMAGGKLIVECDACHEVLAVDPPGTARPEPVKPDYFEDF